jgi:hypothetical protein
MTGKVFISCGQAEANEKAAAASVLELLRTKFNLTPYLAIQVQSLDDIMIITDELRSSDYFLFIDFNRLSVFTHQELALAHHLGFGGDIIALRQGGASDMQGFMRYVLSNPTRFDTTDELLEQVKRLVQTKGWNSRYSRNLVVGPTLTRSGAVHYVDHTGQSVQESWRVKIENHRPDTAALGVVCVLDTIRFPSGENYPSADRGYLKWVGHQGYERTILPQTSEEVDVFAIRRDQPGIFLLSTLDVVPRQAIATENGAYELNYKVFARDFPLLRFKVRVSLQWQPTTPITWTHRSDASLKV